MCGSGTGLSILQPLIHPKDLFAYAVLLFSYTRIIFCYAKAFQNSSKSFCKSWPRFTHHETLIKLAISFVQLDRVSNIGESYTGPQLNSS